MSKNRKIIKGLKLGGAGIVVFVTGLWLYWQYGVVSQLHIKDDMWLISDSIFGSRQGANMLVMSTDEGLLTVDAELPTFNGQIQSRLDAFDVPDLRYQIITHWHPDHSGGVGQFAGDVITIAHENVAKTLSEPQQGFGLTAPDSFHRFRERPNLFRNENLYATKKSFEFGGKRIELWHFPAAHTNGDTVVYFPDADVICWSSSAPVA